MAALVIKSPLAEQLRAIAEREQRPIEDVLESMIENYAPLTEQVINKRLLALGGITLPSDEPMEPPFSEAEEQALIERAGASGKPASEMVIEERHQGW
jgi:hypothetical protein